MIHINTQNIIQIIGNVGIVRPEDIRKTQNNLEIASFSIATSDQRRNHDGSVKQTSQWHLIKIFSQNASEVMKHITTGTKLIVQGRMRYTVYQNTSGESMFSYFIEPTYIGTSLLKKQNYDIPSNNMINLVGSIEREPSISQIPSSEIKVLNFKIKTVKNITTAQGEEKAINEGHEIKFYGYNAERLYESLQNVSEDILIFGKMRYQASQKEDSSVRKGCFIEAYEAFRIIYSSNSDYVPKVAVSQSSTESESDEDGSDTETPWPFA